MKRTYNSNLPTKAQNDKALRVFKSIVVRGNNIDSTGIFELFGEQAYNFKKDSYYK